MNRNLIRLITALLLLAAISACGDDDGGVFDGSTTSEGDSVTTAVSTTTTGETSTTAASTTTAETTTTSGAGDSALGGLVAGALAQGVGADDAVVAGGEEECFTSGLSQAIGAERFAELDAIADDAADMSEVFGQMTEPELDALVEVIGTCIDVEAMLTAEMTSDELSPEAVACLAGTFSEEDTLHSLIRATMTGEDPTTNPEFMALMIQVMTEDCVEPMEAMLVDEFVAGGMSADSAACVAGRFMRGGLFASLLNTMLSGTDFPTDPELQDQMMSAFTECLTPEEMGNLGG
ncbi:MAG TPA: hypothetical protein VLS92_10585 [Acidimicrobiia bacterium]|nr:hypothetical protein [Acidimicrobiia bacterium]